MNEYGRTKRFLHCATQHSGAICVFIGMGLNMPFKWNCIPLFRMVARFFSYIILHVPTYMGKGGEFNIFGHTMFSPIELFYEFEIRICISERILFVSPNSNSVIVIRAACADLEKQNKKITPCMNSYYNSYKLYELVQKPHRVRICEFVL
jgi:hypothetical protein